MPAKIAFTDPLFSDEDKARDLIGFSFLQFVVHVPLVLTLLWLLGMTVAYHPPVMP